MVADSRAAMIATFNLAIKYFTRTRDFGVVTTDPAQVAPDHRGVRSRLGPS